MKPPGGPFTLVDHNGRTITNEDYSGKFMLIAFGYTYCPDVCPTGLQGMSEVMDMLGEKADQLQPIFITIDPERDTPDVLKEYVAAFHPRLIGLSGTSQQLADVAREFQVFYSKITPHSDEGKSEDGEQDNYSMGHTTSIYLVSTDGKGLAVFNMMVPAVEKMAERILHFINIHEALAKTD